LQAVNASLDEISVKREPSSEGTFDEVSGDQQ
jgi:hypothetical protein